MTTVHKKLSFLSPRNVPRLKDLQTERLKRSSSNSKEKNWNNFNQNSSGILNSQENSVRDLDMYWRSMKKTHLRNASISHLSQENSVLNMKRVSFSKFVPKSYIKLESKEEKVEKKMNSKLHMKNIYENYSNVYQKQKLNASPLSKDKINERKSFS